MDEQLYHYGVKGMKWGIRRTPAQLGHVPKGLKVKHKPNALQKMVKSVKVKRDASKEKKAKEKAIKERGPGAGMSNQELRSAIERLRLEEDYKALLARANPQKQSKAKDLFAKTALNMADQAFNAIGKNMIESAFQKKFDPAMYDIKDPSKADPKLLSDAIKYKQDQKKYKELTGATTAQTQKGKKSGGQQTQPASSGSGSKTKQTSTKSKPTKFKVKYKTTSEDRTGSSNDMWSVNYKPPVQPTQPRKSRVERYGGSYFPQPIPPSGYTQQTSKRRRRRG